MGAATPEAADASTITGSEEEVLSPADTPEARAERAGELARLLNDLDPRPTTSWSLLEGCPRPPTIPAATAGIGSTVYVATENRLAAFDLERGAWEEAVATLPESVGTGVAVTSDGSESVFVTSGGGRRSVWRFTPADGALTRLPEPPQDIGRGAALAFASGVLFLAPGMRTDDFLALAPGADRWANLGRIGGPAKVVTTFGRNAGFLAALRGSIYAAPDHHLQRFLIESKSWGKGVWLAMGFRPTISGGGFAADDEVGSVFAAAGMYSRSLNEIVPSSGYAGEFYYVRPRLPYPMIGEGDRLAIARKGGVPHLVAYAVEPDNTLCVIPCDQLTRLTADDTRADEGTPWRRLHSAGGGSGIRRRAELGERDVVQHAPGTMGVLGAVRGELFFMRLANVRRIEPESGAITFYPGFNVGGYLAPGCDGAFDGERYLYMTAGDGDLFVRWDVPETPPEKRPFSGTRRPVHETDLELLPPLPEPIGDGAAIAAHGGAVYALQGKKTRTFWRFDVAKSAWHDAAPLPDEAGAAGELGTGLVANDLGVFAVPDGSIWRYDPAADTWERFADLPFVPSWDGGMVALDGDRHLYVFQGGISTRFGRLDLATRAYEELGPRPPDTIASEGNRLAILTVAGERRLYVHRGHNSNEILWVKLADLRAEKK